MAERTRQPELNGARCVELIGLLLVIVMLVGCSTTWPTRPTMDQAIAGGPVDDAAPGESARDEEVIVSDDGGVRPLVLIHVPGISGIWFTDRNWAFGLQDAGIGDIRKFEWTGPIALLNLFDDDLHSRQAGVLAAMIRGIWAENGEGARIVITAHSGGTRVALLAIEMLAGAEDGGDGDEGGQGIGLVEQVWLIASALDPDYDLGPALNYVPRLVSVQSAGDGLILGAGTSLFGTADNFHGDAAGKVGFNIDDARLEVWEFDSGWREYGAGSGHLGILKRKFAGEIIGPSILGWGAEVGSAAILRRPADDADSVGTMEDDDESN